MDHLVAASSRLLTTDTKSDVDKNLLEKIGARAVAIVHSLIGDLKATVRSEGFLVTHQLVKKRLIRSSAPSELQQMVDEGANSLIFSLIKFWLKLLI